MGSIDDVERDDFDKTDENLADTTNTGTTTSSKVDGANENIPKSNI